MSNYDGNERILLVVGLGNPGAEYEGTRHNAGFMVIDRLLAGFPAGRFEARHVAQSFVHAGMFRGKPLFLQKPQTFMNLSGLAVAGFARKEGIRPEEILVVSDDLDLPVGRLRLRTGGSDGGHNGLKSISQALGTRDYIRLRCGIGRPPGRQDPADFVLSPFSARERADLGAVIEEAADAAVDVLARGLTAAQMRLHTDRG